MAAPQKHVRKVRWYQKNLFDFMTGGGRRAIVAWHRRAGKDQMALQVCCELAHKEIGNIWYCLPEYSQGRKAIWDSVNPHTGKRRIDEAFPPSLRKRTVDQTMFIELNCGSTWQVIGADSYDSTVGSSPKGIVYSEFALSNPSAWAYHKPILEENNGWAMFISTPRGKNHFHDMFRYAETNPDWFAERLTIEDTRALTDAQLLGFLKEYESLYGEDAGAAIFQQEYFCDFNAALPGAFYAREIARLRNTSRIQDFDHIENQPVHRAWDIGVKDDTSVWFFQIETRPDGSPRPLILDCYSTSGAGVEHYAEVIHARHEEHDWKHGTDFVPHDAKIMEWGTGRTRVETMRDFNLRPILCPKASKMDGIQAARTTIDLALFHTRTESPGIEALENYRREWSDEMKCFKPNEVHDWSSHLSDAFRYLSLSWKQLPAKIKPKVLPFVQASPGNWRLPPAPNDLIDTNHKGRIDLTGRL